MDERYNGWANYETWAAHLWLTNEEGPYNYWREAAAEAVREAPELPQVTQGIWAESQAARYTLADRLKDEVEEGMPELETSLYSDLLNSALQDVDWHEVAAAFLEAEQA